MIEKKRTKMSLKGIIFGFFFAMISVFGTFSGVLVSQGEAFAVTNVDSNENNEASSEEEQNAEEQTGEEQAEDNKEEEQAASTGDQCQNSLGSIGWIVCPTTGKIAEAVDWLYDKIQNILTIDPIEAEDGTPIYEIWKYCRGLTNVVFIIFLLVVIYSQLTGLGISNYGIKKILPKLIVVAILVNLSFLICSLAVDVSNIIGSSLRGIFTSVEESVVAGLAGNGATAEMKLSQAGTYSALAGGTALAIGGAVIAFETGAIWMLIPVLLGAIVAVATGLITIALRQAVVALLIMISPLAIVAYMLPNTENLFKKWKKLLTQMLVFYPMFSLLFGASSLAGFAIIMSAKDGFGVLLGTAVQIFPLFFSWKMMKMSSTFLGTINGSMQRLASAPLAKNRAWADSHRQLSKQRYLASDRAATPSLRLMQFMSNRKIARDTETSEKAALAKNRALAYRASRNYDRNGVPTRRGEAAYRDQALSMEYQRIIERDKNNMNKGLGQLDSVRLANPRVRARLDALDVRTVRAADNLYDETERGKKIDHDNAEGRWNRYMDAINVTQDEKYGYKEQPEYITDEEGRMVRNPQYRPHLTPGTKEYESALERFNSLKETVEGGAVDIMYVAGSTAVDFDSHAKVVKNTFTKYFELTAPTRDVELRLNELTMQRDASKYIDAIIPGLQVLNKRGDTDLVRFQIDNMITGGRNYAILKEAAEKAKDIRQRSDLSDEEKSLQIDAIYNSLNLESEADVEGIKLGTHASQELASFLMFDVKDNDPFLRRFGKYINLETAQAYNKNKRKQDKVTLDEYITGEYEELDGSVGHSKRSMAELLEGTSFDGVERTAFDNMETAVRRAYTDERGNVDWERYKKKREELDTAILPAVLGAILKYPSGSEAIKAATRYVTGLEEKNGVMNETWVENFVGHEEEAGEFYRNLTERYIGSSTLQQIINQRSDFKNAYIKNLSDSFLGTDADKLTEKERGWKEKWERELEEYAAISASEHATAEQKKIAKQNEKQLREKIAIWKFQSVIGPEKMERLVHMMLRSSAGAGAKDWTRGWGTATFNDDGDIVMATPGNNDPSDADGRDYLYDDPTFRELVTAEMEIIYNETDNSAEGVDEFFERTLDNLEERYGGSNPRIKAYKKFRADFPRASKESFFDVLKGLIDRED